MTLAPEHTATDGTTRKNHYGSGRQPWDDIKDAGWAPHFAAANVLKYMRRTKDPEHSLESERWYYKQLWGMAQQDMRAMLVLQQLQGLLLGEEMVRLRYEGIDP